MIARLLSRRSGPIGLDIGTRSLKMVQFSADRTRLIAAARTELPTTAEAAPETSNELIDALRRMREEHDFCGRNVVVCLSSKQLFVQNVKVPKAELASAERHVQQEVAGRIPFPAVEADIRYLDGVDVRQGETLVREVIAMACHKPVLQNMLDIVESVGWRPQAVDVEPAAFVRSYLTQFRRDDDRKQRAMFVHVGYSRTGVVILQGEEILFVKYVDVGGRHFDESVARNLAMTQSQASDFRRHNGDRRSDTQDPEVVQSLANATRQVTERLAAELSMCMRYHSVTFRGQPLARLLLGGGEANPQLLASIAQRLDLKCELSDPLRSFVGTPQLGRKGQWDIAAGLALRDLN